MKITVIMTLLLTGISWSAVQAADMLQEVPAVPEPPVMSSGELGIWGAIAYSPSDQKSGIFWGGSTRAEAEETALRYCNNNNGIDCSVVQTYRNHRHWNDDDGRYPYNQCAALAVNRVSGNWGAFAASTMYEARNGALAQCGDSLCKMIEQGCT